MAPVWLMAGFVIALGAVVGSFLNVVILRTHAHKPFINGRSRCPNCDRALAWFELIPIVSWIALGGRCRTCQAPLSRQYPIVEALTITTFALAVFRFGLSWQLLAAMLVIGAMIVIAIYDARWALIPDSFTLGLAVGALAFALVSKSLWSEILIGAVAGAAFFGLQFWLSRRRWVGSGDIFLGAALGLLLGWRMLGLALMLAYMTGAVVAAVMLLRRRVHQNSMVAFGPYLVLGGFVAWLYGEQLVDWYYYHAIFR